MQIKKLTSKIFDHPVDLLSGLLGLYVALFYSGHNSDRLTISILITNIILITLFTLFMTRIILWIFDSRIFLSFSVQKKWTYITSFVFVLFAYSMRFPIYGLFALLMKSYTESSSLLDLFFSILYTLIFLGGLCLFWYSIFCFCIKKSKEILLVYLLLLLFPLHKTIDAVISNLTYESKIPPSPQIDKKWIFKKRQNVYFLLFDSYTSPKGLEILGQRYSKPEKVNITSFLEQLSKREFYVYDSFYTNTQPTRNALFSYFGMHLSYEDRHIYEHSFNDTNKMISEGGLVYQIFKGNNYKINIPINRLWFGNPKFKSDFLSKSDFNYRIYFELFDKIILDSYYGLMFYDPSKEQVLSDLQQSLVFIKNQDQSISHFTYLHYFQPFHTPTKKRGICNEDFEFLEYMNRVHSTNENIVVVIDTIRNVDSNAIVIVASDHGPYLFNRCSKYVLNTRQEIIERQHAFLAIYLGKTPEDRDSLKFKKDDIKSSVNLFRYIFAYLAENDNILKDKPPDDAFYVEAEHGPIRKSIDDGQIIENSAKQVVVE